MPRYQDHPLLPRPLITKTPYYQGPLLPRPKAPYYQGLFLAEIVVCKQKHDNYTHTGYPPHSLRLQPLSSRQIKTRHPRHHHHPRHRLQCSHHPHPHLQLMVYCAASGMRCSWLAGLQKPQTLCMISIGCVGEWAVDPGRADKLF